MEMNGDPSRDFYRVHAFFLRKKAGRQTLRGAEIPEM